MNPDRRSDMGIDLTIDDGVATIVINRPECHNALDQRMYRDLSAAWMQVRDDPDIRCAVVSGAGQRAFCAGADLSGDIAGADSVGRLALTQQDMLLNRGLEVWKPVVAAVNGYCLGGGMTLLLATDIRIAGTDATFRRARSDPRVPAGERRNPADDRGGRPQPRHAASADR